jgi:hypothetical protein
MNTINLRTKLSVVALATCTLVHSGRVACADALYAGTINAVISDPVFTGFYLDTAGNPVFSDDTATASYSIINSGSTAELISGDNSGGAGAPSEIIFFGNTFSGVSPGQDFDLGTITYNNGTSTINTLLFGATLTLSVAGNPSITPVSIPFQITTTANGGFSAVLDADFLTFPAPISLQFHVYEGGGATAVVTGHIFGDPVLVADSIQIPADQSNNGFLTPAPAPSTLVMLSTLAISFFGVGGLRKRLKRTAAA